MNAAFLAFERASVFGFAALLVAFGAQWILNGRVPSSWRVWLWRAALLQTAFALVPLAPLRLAVLRPAEPVTPVVSVRANAPQFRIHARSAPKVSAPASVSENVPTPVASVPVSPAPRISPRVETVPAPRVETVPAPRVETVPAPRVETVPAPRVETVAAPRVWNWRIFILTFYVLGLGIQLVMLARSFGRVRRLLRACSSVEDANSRAQLGEIARRMDVRSQPRLLEMQSGAPFLTGVLRPAIVLPRAFLQHQNPALEPVLSHELAHQKRRDLAWNALLWLVETLFWFHPLVWISRRFLALETESACDEMVLSSTRVAPKFYGALLINTMNTSQTPLAVGVNDGFFALKTRLQRLNQAPKHPRRAARIAFAAALCCAFGALVPIRFVARAQVAAPLKSRGGTVVKGRVVDENGKSVAGATVYAFDPHHDNHLVETVLSDSKGAFAFSPTARAAEAVAVEVVAEAGARGMGYRSTFFWHRGQPPFSLQVSPSVKANLRFVDSRGVPVAGLNVRCWRVCSLSRFTRLVLPQTASRSLEQTTNARGEVMFGPLPAKMMAQFWITSKGKTPREVGVGARFGQLDDDDLVSLDAPVTRKTIVLLPKAAVEAHIFFPDGRAVQGASFWCRPVLKNPASNAISAGASTGRRGTASLNGLKPGMYSLGVWPGQKFQKSWLSISTQKTMQAGLNRVNVTLSRAALVQGVVLSQKTGKPVKGQTMGLFGAQDNYQYAITDARGFFQFPARAGKQHLWVHANGQNSPPPGFILPMKSQFDFVIQNGQKREFKIELPVKAVTKPTTGTVVGPDGNAVAGAKVLVRMAGTDDDSGLRSLQADANGRFALPIKLSARPAQLFAEAGELSTAHSVIALSGGDVKLPLQANAWAQVGGRVTDENDKTVAGARVRLSTSLLETRDVLTDAAGQFEFERVRPGATVYLSAQRVGYVNSQRSAPFLPLQPGKRVSTELLMESAPETLRGQVLRENGQPASGFQVSASGMNGEVLTDKDGRFFLPQVIAGTLSVSVSRPDEMRIIQGHEFSARGGDQNAVFRLSRANSSRVLMFARMTAAQRPVVIEQEIDALKLRLKQAQAKRSAPGSPSAQVTKRQVAELQGKIDALQAEREKVSPAPHVWSRSQRAYARKFFSESNTTGWVRAMSWRSRDTRPNRSLVAPRPSGLVGRKAPPLRVIRWLDVQKPPFGSFAGRVTLMAFESFYYRRDLELDDIARSFAGKMQVVAIERNSRWTTPTMERAVSLRDIARAAPFPIALDSLPPGRWKADGLTAKSFGNAKFVVVGRDGRIVYAGDELDWAITFAAAASK